MLNGQSLICVIPARLNSSRFPKKILSMLGDKPLLQWVWEAAGACSFFDEIVFAIDAKETQAMIESFGGKAIMTPVECQSGTDRLSFLKQSGKLSGDIWVNWQGDEPFVKKETIETLLQSIGDQEQEIWTLKKKITTSEQLQSPHIVKVVTDKEGKALYFSRCSIPYGSKEAHKHIGLYAFRERALEKISHLVPSSLEKAEKLEQLRFLENGLSIHVHETSNETLGIDLPEHLEKASEKLKALL